MRRRFIAIQNSFDYKNYMTIEALSDDVALYVYIDGVEYTKDGFKWNKVFESKRLDIPKGEKYSFKRITQQGEELNTFNISGQVNLKGNCLSLLFGDNANKHTSISGYIRAFEYLFSDNASIQSVDSGFLPATTLANGCYSGMFFRCTNLTTAPELPATTLTSNCYAYMFLGCTNLNYIKALFTTLPASEYTDYWVRNVSPTGTFVKNPEATWEVYGVNGIPDGWKVVMDGEERVEITFYIDGVEYQAEEGMTWSDWCNDTYYSKGEWFIAGTVVHDKYHIVSINAYTYDIIVSGQNYRLAAIGGGGGGH